MASHQHQAGASRTFMEVVESSTRSSKGVYPKRARNEQWERSLERDWQGHLKTLRQCVCELLIKNEQLRMEQIRADRAIHE